jgi:hypothetical protein
MTTNDQLNTTTALTPAVAKSPYELAMDKFADAQQKADTWRSTSKLQSEMDKAAVFGLCHDLIGMLRSGTPEDREAVFEELERRGHSFNANASLERKVAVAIFGDTGQLDTETAILLYAKDHYDGSVPFYDWMKSEGGSDAIRRKSKDGKSRSDVNEEHRKLAKEDLSVAPVIVPRFKAPKELLPSSDSGHRLSVAVLHTDANGQTGIVRGVQDEAVVKSVLTAIGKKIDADLEADAKEEARKIAEQKRQQRLAERQSAAADAMSDEPSEAA